MAADNPKRPTVEPGGFQNLLGYEITDWDVGQATIVLDVDERHGNRHGLAHGGVLMTILDAACTRAGAVDPETDEIRRAATVSMTTNFVAPVKPGRVRAEAVTTGGGRRLFFAEAKAYDADGNLVATAAATCRYASPAK
ncbi:MAG: PaaI family thioesterase [Magnetovibrio sp.]|nr:PaaI family thioesterase [Magnetovibrio sp.]